jgi:hypothetical protein
MSSFSTIVRPGQRNVAGNVDANLLTQFSGEVLRTYQAECKLEKFTRVRSIDNGRTAEFAGIGTVAANYLAANGNVDGILQTMPFAQKNVSVDGLFVAPVFVPDIDEMLMHYDIRGPIAQELGTALAIATDRRILRTMVKGARIKDNWINGRPPGSSGARSNTSAAGADQTTVATGLVSHTAAQLAAFNASLRVNTNTAASMIDQIYILARILTEKNCPMSDRFLVMRPSAYYTLVANPTSITSRDWNGANAMEAAKARVPALAELEITMLQPQIFTQDNTSSPGELGSATGFGGTTGNSYRVDIAPTRFVAGHKSAVATLKLLDINIQTEYSVRNQGTLILARCAQGHDVLRPEFLAESCDNSTPYNGPAATAGLVGTLAADGTNA